MKSYKAYLDMLKFAKLIGEQSQCLSRHVGACLVKNHMVVSTGFNQTPCNTKPCKECIRHSKKSGESLDICKAIHAEEMCILNYLKNHTIEDLKDCILFVSVAPCYNCAKLITHLGIKKVYALEDYNSKYTKEIFSEGKVELIIL